MWLVDLRVNEPSFEPGERERDLTIKASVHTRLISSRLISYYQMMMTIGAIGAIGAIEIVDLSQ